MKHYRNFESTKIQPQPSKSFVTNWKRKCANVTLKSLFSLQFKYAQLISFGILPFHTSLDDNKMIHTDMTSLRLSTNKRLYSFHILFYSIKGIILYRKYAVDKVPLIGEDLFVIGYWLVVFQIGVVFPTSQKSSRIYTIQCLFWITLTTLNI